MLIKNKIIFENTNFLRIFSFRKLSISKCFNYSDVRKYRISGISIKKLIILKKRKLILLCAVQKKKRFFEKFELPKPLRNKQ